MELGVNVCGGFCCLFRQTILCYSELCDELFSGGECGNFDMCSNALFIILDP